MMLIGTRLRIRVVIPCQSVTLKNESKIRLATECGFSSPGNKFPSFALKLHISTPLEGVGTTVQRSDVLSIFRGLAQIIIVK